MPEIQVDHECSLCYEASAVIYSDGCTHLLGCAVCVRIALSHHYQEECVARRAGTLPGPDFQRMICSRCRSQVGETCYSLQSLCNVDGLLPGAEGYVPDVPAAAGALAGD